MFSETENYYDEIYFKYNEDGMPSGMEQQKELYISFRDDCIDVFHYCVLYDL